MFNVKEKASMKNAFFILAFFMLLSSCAEQSKRPSQGFSSQKLSATKTSIIGTAKEYIIPIPLGFHCTDKQKTSAQQHYVTHYEGTLSLEKVIHFYRQEMEQRGGIFSDFADKTEGIFYSNNPLDEYACYIKTHNNKTLITCFYKAKKTVANAENKDINSKKDYLF